jgi:penicillin amidase
MYGDAKGNVAWWATGKLYKHQAGVNPNFILDGASGKEDIEFWISPKSVCSKSKMELCLPANNQPEPVDGFPIRILSPGRQSQTELHNY